MRPKPSLLCLLLGVILETSGQMQCCHPCTLVHAHTRRALTAELDYGEHEGHEGADQAAAAHTEDEHPEGDHAALDGSGGDGNGDVAADGGDGDADEHMAEGAEADETAGEIIRVHVCVSYGS